MNSDTRMHEPSRPVVATLVATVRDGRILLIRRANEPDQGRWAFPGGKIKFGEDLVSAAMRELLEETGVEATSLGVFTATDIFNLDSTGHLAQHFVLVGLLCEWRRGEVLAGDDALEARWFFPEELSSFELAQTLNVSGIVDEAFRLMTQRRRSIFS